MDTTTMDTTMQGTGENMDQLIQIWADDYHALLSVPQVVCIFHSVCRVGRFLTSPSADILKLLHSILRSFAIIKISLQMIHQINLGSEQQTSGLFFCSFEVIVSVCMFFSFTSSCFPSTRVCLIHLSVDKLTLNFGEIISECSLFQFKLRKRQIYEGFLAIKSCYYRIQNHYCL